MIGKAAKLRSAGGVMPIFATAIVLLSVFADRSFLYLSPSDAEPYQAAVKKSVESLPMTFGSWLGMDVPVPEAAVKMLHPNVILSRRFQNIATNETVTFLLVDVRDARDILGHYPPACYPGQGWKNASATETDWIDDARTVHGTEYLFTRDRVDTSASMIVDNFMITRGGKTCRDMDGVEKAAEDGGRRVYGAAQIQIVTDRTISPERRKAIAQQFINYCEPALRAISDGERNGK